MPSIAPIKPTGEIAPRTSHRPDLLAQWIGGSALLLAASWASRHLPSGMGANGRAAAAVCAGIGVGALTYRVLQAEPCQAVLRWMIRFGWLIAAAAVSAMASYS